jgi:hypothetical protein
LFPKKGFLFLLSPHFIARFMKMLFHDVTVNHSHEEKTDRFFLSNVDPLQFLSGL